MKNKLRATKWQIDAKCKKCNLPCNIYVMKGGNLVFCPKYKKTVTFRRKEND